ncbi:NAD-binding protein [Rhizobium lusitanum]|uniref:NAD-binding protein n=2 Tax=Rhizobium lusitanum TaxID=293958 RepID=A0A6L9UHR6_9HYPH|nr:NAD-binding protein [Rhizobium lusitanum]
MKIGLIGLGNMGFHFGYRLLDAGLDLTVYDTNQPVVETLRSRGAKSATSGKDLASHVEIVLMSLPSPPIVKEVVLSENGVGAGSSVKCIVDLSTTGPTASRAIAAAVAAKDIRFIGAPVSGGTVAAEKGTLAIMASGDREYFDKLKPVLDVLGKQHFFLGEDAGLGQTIKVINNTLCAVAMVSSMEALVFGTKAGLDAQAMLDIINVSTGRSFATQERIPQTVINRNFPNRFATELMHKDVKLCLEEAENMGATMLVSPAARAFLSFAISQGDGQKDFAETIKHFEHWAGAQFGSEPN